MGKNQPPPPPQQQQQQQAVSVKATVYKLQLALLEGVKTLDHLYLAGTIISRADYNDVVTERTIADLCGYPLCSNALPPESSRPRKGQYHISLKEHKVYDLSDTYSYCGSRCLIESKAFSKSLSEERCDVLDFGKVERVLRAFEVKDFEDGDGGSGEVGDLGISGLKIDEKSEKGEKGTGDLGISKLKIEEKSERSVGDSGFVGPSNAIEGYVPQNERMHTRSGSKKNEEGSKGKDTTVDFIDRMIDSMDVNVIASDEYSVSKMPVSVEEIDYKFEIIESKGNVGAKKKDSLKKSGQSRGGKSKIVKKDDVGIREMPSTSDASQSEAMPRSSLKPSGSKKLNRSVTWADEKVDRTGSRNLCEVREMDDRTEPSLKPSAEKTKDKSICEVREVQAVKEVSDALGSLDLEDNERLESAEACAMALCQAAEAVAAGESDVNGAVLGAGITILPHPDGVDEEKPAEDVTMLEPEEALQWPLKPGIPRTDLFDPDDSWFDAPPDGFSLTLSPFATMWNSLFQWITSSTLAYIYGRDESLHEEFLFVNGKSYPTKIVLAGGRSSEIKKTLAESLARALPGIVSEFRLATPVSNLEQAMGRMLDTMCFIDAIPAFRMKQWKVIVLLFLEGLSVCRIPALTPHMSNRRMVLRTVTDGTQISTEHYELMKDLILPLGRAPEFSAQRGA